MKTNVSAAVVLIMCAGAMCLLGVPAYAQAPTGEGVPDDAVCEGHEAVSCLPHEVVPVFRTIPPPAPLEEPVNIGESPAPTAVWTPGYWRWEHHSNRYVWEAGIWRVPPPDLTWYPGRWERTVRGWYWVSGHWGPKGNPDLLISRLPPPRVKQERRSPPPGPGYVWVPGYWRFDGRGYAWVPGAWRRPVQPGMVWAEGQWIRTYQGYQHIPGHWDYASGARKAAGPQSPGDPPGYRALEAPRDPIAAMRTGPPGSPGSRHLTRPVGPLPQGKNAFDPAKRRGFQPIRRPMTKADIAKATSSTAVEHAKAKSMQPEAKREAVSSEEEMEGPPKAKKREKR